MRGSELTQELSEEKKLIIHGAGAARFLGYEITVQHDKHCDDRTAPPGARAAGYHPSPRPGWREAPTATRTA
jgi:hypothetical protein